ncbi:alpha/beta hydrolase [Hymenobacter lutimineralis]|uniref:Alpha/beta hydrolase n=1 Tax=Hymenobacter lutimineralis TaxID=2606448 RepID=A0A5D6VGY6_9BACT|nr:alpha/beta hydrolase [Hymenobacter lutimineralis]TYZ14362.1 alpha/beta hydrolase [Hymenobacter lutimineralis]
MKFSPWLCGAVLLLTPVLLLAAHEYATARASLRTADLPYVAAAAPDFDAERHRLDVYSPRKGTAPRPVVVFIHGGSWNSGSKDFYAFIGRRLARQGLVAVVVNYRLSPQVQVPAMAFDCARAVRWTEQHIREYGGDPARIFLLGHSAGGGLAALLATDNALFARLGQPHNPVRGVVLDDAAGLNMYTYLQKQQYPGDAAYLVPFGPDARVWQQVSPYYHLTRQSPPFLVFVGGKTYPSIRSSSEEFCQRLRDLGQEPRFTVLPGKKHAAMVLQLYWPRNIIYQQIKEFVGLPPTSAAPAGAGH